MTQPCKNVMTVKVKFQRAGKGMDEPEELRISKRFYSGNEGLQREREPETSWGGDGEALSSNVCNWKDAQNYALQCWLLRPLKGVAFAFFSSLASHLGITV